VTRSHGLVAGVLWLLLLSAPAGAQDLDPRAYAKVPVGFTAVIEGFSFSTGGVLTDPTLPVENVHAKVWTPSLSIARSFGLAGRTAQVLAALPYSWLSATGDVGASSQQVDRSGFSDMRFRLSVLLAGAPAMTAQQFATSARKPIVGASLTVVAPTGQYDPERLVNIGTNRWAFKPEVAFSYPLGRRWLVDAYAAFWLFTTNGSYYTGTAARTETPIGALQAHISYSFSLKAWAAFDATWYAGGRASVNGLRQSDRQQNSRLGGTLVVPVASQHSVKFSVSTGVTARFGTNFTTVSVAWQTGWVSRRPAQTPSGK
jgi:hypothetical protein